ncbi:MAG: hypothetical protein VX900_05290, partial [Pseudomonadota bacterium]|nr:hypothetical protein [Pseudomonadota bacterium]
LSVCFFVLFGAGKGGANGLTVKFRIWECFRWKNRAVGSRHQLKDSCSPWKAVAIGPLRIPRISMVYSADCCSMESAT